MQPRLTTISLLQLPAARPRGSRRLVVAAQADTGQVGWAAACDQRDRWPALERAARTVIGMPVLDATRRQQMLGLAGPTAPAPADLAAGGLIDDAALDLGARIAGAPLALWLGGHAHPTVRLADRLDWAAMEDDPEPAERIARLVDRARRRIERHGFGALTLLPAGAPASAVQALVEALRGAFGNRVALRLDATGYPVAELRALAPRRVGLDLLIDPGRTLPALRALAVDAAPAAVTPGPSLPAIMTGGLAQAVRLEPAVQGGARQALRIAAQARVFQLELLLAGSSGLAIELAHLAHLAHAVPGALQPLDAEAEAALHSGIEIRDGAIRLPAGAGLGITIDQQRLEHDALRRLDIDGTPS